MPTPTYPGPDAVPEGFDGPDGDVSFRRATQADLAAMMALRPDGANPAAHQAAAWDVAKGTAYMVEDWSGTVVGWGRAGSYLHQAGRPVHGHVQCWLHDDAPALRPSVVGRLSAHLLATGCDSVETLVPADADDDPEALAGMGFVSAGGDLHVVTRDAFVFAPCAPAPGMR